ncbi:unnamed protein product [Urochloa decumbens]|uniref:AP2/ERF domain-containing protein n=1 Tax=Urochloa decumbens TaxID=240449 RepID=A0ABC9A5S8_9POAL
MTRPHCAATPLSPSSRGASSSLSCVSSSASSSSGSCYLPAPWPPKRGGKKRWSDRRRAKNGAAGAVPRRNSSIYRGVTRHRGTGKFEAHLWDGHVRNPTKSKKGRQDPKSCFFVGAFDNEEAAAHTYDLAALKYWGSNCQLNFPLESYKQEHERMQRMTREAYLATLRRGSSSFSRGASAFRGVARHHQNGRWEARIGYASGKKYLYLGTYGTQEEAARAYDLAALDLRGHTAITNFDISCYADYLQRLLEPPRPALKPKAEPVVEALAPPPTTTMATASWNTPLLTPKPDPEDELLVDPLASALPPGPVLRDADDVDHAIAEILPVLGMDAADFEARYTARAPGWLPDDDDGQLRGLPLPDAGRFEDDIEALFDAPGGSAAGPGHVDAVQLPAAVDDASGADAVSYAAAAAISSLASGRWR